MKNSINLLPASFRRQQFMRARAYQWSAAICLVLAVGWVWHGYEVHEHHAMVQRLELLKREHQPTQLMLGQLVDMRKKLDDLEEQERIARELERQRNALTLLGVVSQTAQKTNGRLRVTSLELTNFQSQPQPEGDVAGLHHVDQPLGIGEGGGRRVGEDRVALQLDEAQWRGQLRDDQGGELGHDAVGVLQLCAGEERGVAGDVGEDEIALLARARERHRHDARRALA